MSDLEAAVRAASSRDLPRAELSAAIVARLAQLDAPPKSIAAAKKIAQPKSVVVVAGQQPILFGGPGLVWAKADDALQLAAAIDGEFGVPAVAVFWNASEDHDHAECDHVEMDLAAGVETLRVPLPGDRRMLSRVPVPAEARALLEKLRAKFPNGPSRDEILSALEPAPDDTMGSWFSRILLRRLGGRGLVVVEPGTVRPFARSVVDFETARPGELAASIRRSMDEAATRGFPRAFDLQRDELFFLVDDAGRRLRVERDGDAWRDEDGRVVSTSELRALPPSAFSWNVAARVLAQNTAFPVATHFCGPSEILYCARLDQAHALLGLPPQQFLPRSGRLYVTPRVERLSRELGVDPWSVVARGGERLLAPRASPPEPEELRVLRETVKKLPAGGSGAVQSRRAALAKSVDAYAEALRRDASDADAAFTSRRERLLALLLPHGKRQDAVFSPLPWEARLDPRRPPEEKEDDRVLDRNVVFHVLPPNQEPSA